jgi:hypothetical protein
MATPQQLRETSRILRKHAKAVRDDADRARAKLSGDARHAHADTARRRQDER